MHILDIQNPLIRQHLYSMSTGALLTRVVLHGMARPMTGMDPGGFPIFAPSPVMVDWDISALIPKGAVSFALEKPIYPGDEPENEFTSGRVTIEVVNESAGGYVAAVGGGGILDIATIEQAQFTIEAYIEAVNQYLPLFKGQVAGPPIEGFGKTTFELYDVTYDAIITPVLFSNFAEKTGHGRPQIAFYLQGAMYSFPYEVTTAHGAFRAHSGYVTYDESGNLVSTLTNNEADKMDLRSFNVLNGAKPGDYTIEFLTATNYKLVYPDNEERFGSITSTFDDGHIRIAPSDWSGVDGEGVKIEFWVPLCTWEGNPGSMVMALIEQAFIGNWGEIPGTNPGTAIVLCDWPAFRRFESDMRGFEIFVSEKQLSNSTWKNQTGTRPMSCIRMAQMIAGHVGASILVGMDGRLTIQDVRLWDSVPRDLTTDTAILPGYTITGPDGGERFNRIVIKYGLNARTGTYGDSYTLDGRTNTGQRTVDKVISMPYWRSGVSYNKVRWIAETLASRYIARPHTFAIRVLPNWHLVAMPGDRFTLRLGTHPRVDMVAEVSRVTAKSPGESGALSLFALQEPEGNPFLLCTSLVGDPVS